jgi:PAS domain-containing protein
LPLRTAVAETLEAWREAESLLAELPPLSPDHETVGRTVVCLRAAYEALTEAAPQTALAIASSQRSIRDAREVLAAVRAGRPVSAAPPTGPARPAPPTSDDSAGAMDIKDPVALTLFPHEDDAFRAHAETIFGSVRDAAELEGRLRSVYPAVTVREQDGVARLGRRRWYVYRDGSPLVHSSSRDWDCEGVGTMLIGRDGRYRSADQAAADVFGVPVDAIPGARIGAFTKHEGSDEGGQRAFELLAQTGSLCSTAVVRTPQGDEWPIEYRIDVEGDAYRMLVRRREG